MDDPVIFETFLRTECGLTVARARNEMVTFVDSFTAVLSTSDNEIDSFVKNIHSSNSARNAVARILIPPSTVIALKAIRFELQDRQRCGALPNEITLRALDTVQMNYLRVQRTKSVQDQAMFSALSKLPDIVVPKLTSTNYEVFNTAFSATVARTIGMNGIPLDYIMRETDGNYDSAWPTRGDKLKNCLSLTGAAYKNDNATLYSLYVQYVGTDGIGSNIINKYTANKNGRKCHQDFESHFRNASYLTNKAAAAMTAMNNAVYNGDRRNFTLETYYTVMSKAFNDLADAGVAHALNDVKKIAAFEQGLKDQQAIQLISCRDSTINVVLGRTLLSW